MVAHQAFDLNARGFFPLNDQGYAEDDVIAERELIAPMVEQCAKWQAPSTLNAAQLKIEYYFDPIPIPVIGYLDFAFDGIDVDLKTTKACPSTPRSDHIRQVSIYRAARNKAGGLLYVTNKRHAYFDVPDDAMNEALAELHADALSLNNFLSRMDTREDAFRSLPCRLVTLPSDQKPKSHSQTFSQQDKAMHIPAPNDKQFELPPAGTHLATCYRVVDLGTQNSNYMGQVKRQHKILLSWELPDELMADGRPFTIGQRYTWSIT